VHVQVCIIRMRTTMYLMYVLLGMRTSVMCGYDRTRVQSVAREGRCPKLGSRL
jgi:hypothetical protein